MTIEEGHPPTSMVASAYFVYQDTRALNYCCQWPVRLDERLTEGLASMSPAQACGK